VQLSVAGSCFNLKKSRSARRVPLPFQSSPKWSCLKTEQRTCILIIWRGRHLPTLYDLPSRKSWGQARSGREGLNLQVFTWRERSPDSKSKPYFDNCTMGFTPKLQS
ncbi:mCG145330, partial [Mus musculus]